MKKELLAKYKNGNYYVKLYNDGTKIKYNNLDRFIPEFAESMDITITTKCDGHCSYCFDEDTEVSTPNGKVKIKDLNKDDLVISYNLDTGILYDNPNIDTEAISLVASHDYLKSYLLDIDTLVKLNNKEIDRQHANINKAESTIKSIEKLNLALMKAKL